MPIYIKDKNSTILFVNKAQSEQWGRAAKELIGVRSYHLTKDPVVIARVQAEDHAVVAGESYYREEHKLHSGTGEEQFRVITKQRCMGVDGEYLVICAFFDTTEWRLAERNRQEALERETLLRERTQGFVQRLIDVIQDPFYIKDSDSRFLMVNEALLKEHGVRREDLIGVTSYSLAPSEEMAEETISEDLQIIEGAQIDKEQHNISTKSGEEKFRNVIKHRCIYIDGSPVIVAAHFDITRWRIAERELGRIANEDALTGLPNRRCFMEEAKRILSRAERHLESLSLVIFDLDHFKRVNDTYGHNVGDAVLREVSKHMGVCLRSEDLPCRWGGEEFVVLLPVTAVDEAMLVANRLRLAIASNPITCGDTTLSVTISGGVAQWHVGESLEAFVNRADMALYKAKGAGRNVCIFADSPLQEDAVAGDEYKI